jgi:Tfp pilus assembly protein PilZ
MQSRRTYTRVSFSDPVRVHLPSRETIVSTLASNLSRGGIFLRFDDPFPKGQKLSLEFNTFQGPVKIKKGEVAWTQIRDPADSGGVSAVPGMGIRFLKLSERARARIGHFVDERIRRQQVRIEDKRINYKAAALPLTDIVEDRNEARRASSAYIIVSRSIKEKATPTPTIQAPKKPFPLTRLLLVSNGVVSTLIVAALIVLFLTWPATVPPPAIEVSPPPKPEPAVAAVAVVPEQPAPTAERSGAAPVGVPKDDTLRVGPPVFMETSGGWIVKLESSAPANIYHFTLEDPPRLVVLFQKTKYSGEQYQIEPELPAVAGVRVQEQVGYTRFIFDFAGWTIPEHTVVKGDNSAQIFFSMDSIK